ncbi:DUF397 domain-containing protein [Nocardia brasiliensis]|uniref:DUF397 domain-containing protein n=1 Tax=Nocardia brasiliensis TaxID=37326 RepID=A0A6G9Y0L7_NOCBR|nr:DUF397 domain-containing protein [Nocardia brasiliensis]QIS06731.1 DUF397 domain-containing protein [Nocardia brasiliensis]
MTTDESGINWRTSSYSGDKADCVEVGDLDNGHIGVRDSKNRTGPTLRFTPAEWDSFTAGVKSGEFDRP